MLFHAKFYVCMVGPQWLSGKQILASNYFQLCVGSTPKCSSGVDLSQYDPGCLTGCKTPTLTFVYMVKEACGTDLSL